MVLYHMRTTSACVTTEEKSETQYQTRGSMTARRTGVFAALWRVDIEGNKKEKEKVNAMGDSQTQSGHPDLADDGKSVRNNIKAQHESEVHSSPWS